MLKYVYKLKHYHVVGHDNVGDELRSRKTIGYYSSLKKAKETIERYKNITGFKDYPDGFYIEKVEIDFDNYEFE